MLGCSKEEEVILEPVFEISLDGQSFDPYERYSVINTFGGEKWVDDKEKQIFKKYGRTERTSEISQKKYKFGDSEDR